MGRRPSGAASNTPHRGPAGTSIHLDVVAIVLLHVLDKLSPFHTLLFGQRAEGLLETALHAFQAAHVHVRLLFLKHWPDLVRILHDLVLNPHLLALFVRHLVRDCIVVSEVIRVELLDLSPLLVVQNGARVRNAKEQPSQASVLVLPVEQLRKPAPGDPRGLVVEQLPHEGSEGGDAGPRSQHDDVRVGLVRQQHLRARGARDQHFVAGLEVADVAGAHAAVDLLRLRELRVLALLNVGILAPANAGDLQDSLHDERDHVVGLVVATGRGGDRVQADLRRRVALLVGARRDDADGLALNVRHLLVVPQNDVGCLPIHQRRLGGDRLVGANPALVRSLGCEQVPRDLLAIHDADPLLLHRCGAARDGGGSSRASSA
mmetsp:Transcript_40727/g.103675  ORF Transcript_40727/g.103675 Transcript_40727/m.103675 type:complete len:375 (-) Transcript_40727:315-1439(-)